MMSDLAYSSPSTGDRHVCGPVARSVVSPVLTFPDNLLQNLLAFRYMFAYNNAMMKRSQPRLQRWHLEAIIRSAFVQPGCTSKPGRLAGLRSRSLLNLL